MRNKIILTAVVSLLGIIAVFIKMNLQKNNLEYKIIQETNIYDSTYNEKGYYINESVEKVILTIAMGEKPTSGYEIKIKKIEINNDKITIEVEETKPYNKNVTLQVITYPTTQIEFNKMPKSINIKSTKGNLYKKNN